MLSFQVASGTWGSDFGKHADEGAHVVTSLMVRDYLAGGWAEQWHPVRYAEDYYERFPKVAIGHYPPGFYLVAALLLLPARIPETLLLLQALLASLAGWATWRFARNWCFPEGAALICAVLVCLLPLVRGYTATVMADLLLVVFGLLAQESWSRFRENPSARGSLAFGLWASAAILTKGSGLMLALLPPLAILVGRHWSMIGDRRLWLAPLPVVVLAFPWFWLTRGITAEGMQHGGIIEYFLAAFPFYLRGIALEAGWVTLLLASAAAGASLVESWRGGGLFAGRAGDLLAFCLGGLFLSSLVPTGLDHRYLLPLVPPVLLLAVSVALRSTQRRKRWQSLATLGVALLILLTTWRPVEKRYGGASEAIAVILEDPQEEADEGDPVRVLVVSDARGEGALTAAAAFRGANRLRVVRGTKLLSRSDWLGRGYASLVESREEFETRLDSEAVQFIVLEEVPEGGGAMAHWNRAASYLAEAESGADPAPRVTELSRVEAIRPFGRRSLFSVFEVNRPRSKEAESAGTEP